VSSSEEDMCTQGGMEPGMCGSRSVSSSSTAAAADEWRMLLLGSDSLRCAISGMATRWCGASLSQVNNGCRNVGFELEAVPKPREQAGWLPRLLDLHRDVALI
jgi:hypothetical protein